MNRALVTIVFGEHYLQGFFRYAHPTWESYAKRWNYDLVVLRAPLDLSQRAESRSIAWQKCLIFEYPELSSFDQLAWLDSDILINQEAPDLFAGVPPNAVGAVVETTRKNLLAPLNQIEEQSGGQKYHRDFGLPPTFATIVQTGVLVVSRAHHAKTLRWVYDSFEDKGETHWNYEMRPLSHTLQSHHPIYWLDPRFNVTWVKLRQTFYPFLGDEESSPVWDPLGPNKKIVRYLNAHDCIHAALQQSYFLHFAGTGFSELALHDPQYALFAVNKVLTPKETPTTPEK